MRKIQDLGRRAAALALAAGMTLSTVPSVLAVDADEVLTPSAQTAEHEQKAEGAEEPADSEEEQPAASDADDGTELPADTTAPKPVVIDPDQLPADSDAETPAASDSEKEEPAGSETEQPVSSGAADVAEQAIKHNHKWKKEKTVAATCTEKGYTLYRCSYHVGSFGCTETKQDDWVNALGHDYGEWVEVEATCTTAGERYRVCKRVVNGSVCGHKEVDDTYAAEHPATGHTYGEWITEPATCTEAGRRYRVCTNTANGKVCGDVEEDKEYAAEHPALDHAWDEGTVEQEFPCVEGVRTYHCTRDGCDATKTEKVEPVAEHVLGDWEVTKQPTCTENGERVRKCTVCGEIVETDTTEGEEIQKLGHDWGDWVDDDNPGCEQQTATRKCQREGCGAAEQKNLPNVGADGNPIPHKYGSFKEIDSFLGVVTKYEGTCVYCGKVQEFDAITDDEGRNTWISDQGTKLAMDNVKVDNKKVDERATEIVNDALKAAQDAVKNAATKEEAVKALEEISKSLKSSLGSLEISFVSNKISTTVKISDEDLNNALKPLDDTIAQLEGTLNDSFLSQDTIQSLVDKLATDVSDSSAPKNGIHQIVYNTVYDTIYNTISGSSTKKTTDNTDVVEDMVLQLVRDTMNSEEGWQDLTDTIVDDAVDEVLKNLKKDNKTYAKLLDSKMGKELEAELREEIRNQLVNDPTFMNNVRGVVDNAAQNAKTGVNKGWSNDKILANLNTDLSSVNELVANAVTKLGSSAGDIVDNKVSDTVHKFLPGLLGDWVGDKVGGLASNVVNKEADKLGSSLTGTITSYLKYFTCGSKHKCDQYKVVKEPTCTEEGEYTYECQYCGWTSGGGKIPATGHTMVEDPAVEATQTETGLTAGSHCSVCGYVEVAQQVTPMLDPSIDTVLNRTATTVEDAKAAGFDSVESINAALNAALAQAGFDPANSEHFTVQVNSSIGILPNDRFPTDGVTGTLTLPEGTKGKAAQTYYAVQVFTADTRFHKAGDVLVTPVKLLQNGKNGMELTVYTEAVLAIAWKAQ